MVQRGHYRSLVQTLKLKHTYQGYYCCYETHSLMYRSMFNNTVVLCGTVWYGVVLRGTVWYCVYCVVLWYCVVLFFEYPEITFNFKPY